MLQELALDELTLRMEEAANGRLPEMQARDYFSQLMAGLHHLHQNNIVHRDIKPDNFMMGLAKRGNQVYIIDFGLVSHPLIACGFLLLLYMRASSLLFY